MAYTCGTAWRHDNCVAGAQAQDCIEQGNMRFNGNDPMSALVMYEEALRQARRACLGSMSAVVLHFMPVLLL